MLIHVSNARASSSSCCCWRVSSFIGLSSKLLGEGAEHMETGPPCAWRSERGGASDRIGELLRTGQNPRVLRLVYSVSAMSEVLPCSFPDRTGDLAGFMGLD